MTKAKKQTEDILLQDKADRRLLSHVPDPTGQRVGSDRRDNLPNAHGKPQSVRFAGKRYPVSVPVKVKTAQGTVCAHSTDISQTGMLLELPPCTDRLTVGDTVALRFRLYPGTLQEGMEKKYRLKAQVVRIVDPEHCAVRFEEPLFTNRRRTKDSWLLTASAACLLLVCLFILLLRVESVTYFAQNWVLYGYSILTAFYLLSRYVFGMLYKPTPVDPDFTPSVTIVIPCFNEATWIRRTILSCIDQDYPPDKLELILVDDGSTDGSVEVIQQTVRELFQEGKRFHTEDRIRVFLQKKNHGKREAMGLGIRNCRTEVIAFVDSDSFLEPDAIRNLVQPLCDPQTAGVTGRTDVANIYTNWLTKLQCVRYYISFRIMKAAEAYFDCVMCLSGPLSCYRLDAVREVLDPWLHQTFLGQKATFGDDRSMTNFIVRNHRTYYQDTAICSTIVPNQHRKFLKQQMRWKRSWLRESLKAASFMWRKEPLMAFTYYAGLLVPLLAPVIVVYNLIYVPITMHVFPTTFLLGLLLMSLLMSFMQLFLKRSSLWLYGLLFCMYYEVVLLWQMPWAWLTFWVSDWGTRDTKGKKKQEAAEPAGQQ